MPGWVVRKVLLDYGFSHVTLLLEELVLESLWFVWRYSLLYLLTVDVCHLITIVPTVEISLIHGQHLWTQLHFIVKDGTLPQLVVLLGLFLPRHVHQWCCTIVLVFLLVFRFFLFFTLTLCLLFLLLWSSSCSSLGFGSRSLGSSGLSSCLRLRFSFRFFLCLHRG